MQAAQRDPRHDLHEKTSDHRDCLAPPPRFHYHPSWRWFTVGCGLLGLFAPLVAAYTQFVFTTGIYSEPDVVLRSSFLALFWALPCYLIVQVVFTSGARRRGSSGRCSRRAHPYQLQMTMTQCLLYPFVVWAAAACECNACASISART